MFKTYMRMTHFNFFYIIKILSTFLIFMNFWWNKFSKFWIILLELFWILFFLTAFMNHIAFMLNDAFFLSWFLSLIFSYFCHHNSKIVKFQSELNLIEISFWCVDKLISIFNDQNIKSMINCNNYYSFQFFQNVS